MSAYKESGWESSGLTSDEENILLGSPSNETEAVISKVCNGLQMLGASYVESDEDPEGTGEIHREAPMEICSTPLRLVEDTAADELELDYDEESADISESVEKDGEEVPLMAKSEEEPVSQEPPSTSIDSSKRQVNSVVYNYDDYSNYSVLKAHYDNLKDKNQCSYCSKQRKTSGRRFLHHVISHFAKWFCSCGHSSSNREYCQKHVTRCSISDKNTVYCVQLHRYRDFVKDCNLPKVKFANFGSCLPKTKSPAAPEVVSKQSSSAIAKSSLSAHEEAEDFLSSHKNKDIRCLSREELDKLDEATRVIKISRAKQFSRVRLNQEARRNKSIARANSRQVNQSVASSLSAKPSVVDKPSFVIPRLPSSTECLSSPSTPVGEVSTASLLKILSNLEKQEDDAISTGRRLTQNLDMVLQDIRHNNENIKGITLSRQLILQQLQAIHSPKNV